MVNALLNLLYPPLCEVCREKSPFRLLCATCWSHTRFADPAERCRHCFSLLEDQEALLCPPCRKTPQLPIRRALVFEEEAPLLSLRFRLAEKLAPFFLYQWVSLDLPLPDFVVPFPDPAVRRLAKTFSSLLQQAFSLPTSPYSKGIDGGCGEVWLTRLSDPYPDRTLLLLDLALLPTLVAPTVDKLLDTFPEELFLLTL